MKIIWTVRLCFVLIGVFVSGSFLIGNMDIFGGKSESGSQIKDGTSNTFQKIPVVVSGDNIYVTWWSNKTGNDEVLFRSSTDGSITFEDKINLSNTTDAESVDAMIDAEGDSVVVTWWERNNTANEPVMRISTDGGQTFGPLLQLSKNGTLGDNESSD